MQDTHSVFDNLVTRTELSEKLGLSESYISKLMSDENLPYFKIGRSVRVRLTEVVVWLQTRRRP
jgi:excisionase family DNA binding protein